MLCLCGFGVVLLDVQGLKVVVHAQAACPQCIVPCKVNAGKFRSCPVGCDCVGLLEGGKQMFSVVFALILDTKVVHSDWSPLVLPETRGNVALVVGLGVESLSEEIVS